MVVTNEMKLVFLSRSVNEALARNAAAVFVSRLDPTLEEVEDIKTAVSEAVTNCIVHAYPDTLGRIVMTGKTREGGMVEICVRDYGKGMADVKKAREPMFTTGGSERSGMGFTIMESFSDKLRVRSAVGGGTAVTIFRQISGRA